MRKSSRSISKFEQKITIRVDNIKKNPKNSVFNTKVDNRHFRDEAKQSTANDMQNRRKLRSKSIGQANVSGLVKPEESRRSTLPKLLPKLSSPREHPALRNSSTTRDHALPDIDHATKHLIFGAQSSKVNKKVETRNQIEVNAISKRRHSKNLEVKIRNKINNNSMKVKPLVKPRMTSSQKSSITSPNHVTTRAQTSSSKRQATAKSSKVPTMICTNEARTSNVRRTSTNQKTEKRAAKQENPLKPKAFKRRCDELIYDPKDKDCRHEGLRLRGPRHPHWLNMKCAAEQETSSKPKAFKRRRDEIIYAPKNNGCRREGLRPRRRYQHPHWINNRSKLDYSIKFTSLNPTDVRHEKQFLNELQASRINPNTFKGSMLDELAAPLQKLEKLRKLKEEHAQAGTLNTSKGIQRDRHRVEGPKSAVKFDQFIHKLKNLPTLSSSQAWQKYSKARTDLVSVTTKIDDLKFGPVKEGVSSAIINPNSGIFRIAPGCHKKEVCSKRAHLSYILLSGNLKMTVDSEVIQAKILNFQYITNKKMYSLDNQGRDPAFILYNRHLLG